MLNEIAQINVDRRGMDDHHFTAVARFRLSDVEFLDEPVLQPDFDLIKFKRFQPYEFDGDIETVFDNEPEDDQPVFIAGKASQTTAYNKKIRDASVTIEKLHTEIIEALEKHLLPKFSIANANLCIERMRFRGNPADVVTQHANKRITIYEVKTSLSGRRNIRDAIAQLLDYAAHSGRIKVRKLVIVSSASLKPAELAFLEHLQETLTYKLEYWCYDKDQVVQFSRQG